ncbi:MAG: hypothetical protein IJ243_11185 [Prevotella sp.]|nr:hypothetical protein [Prevotella sp.]
MTTKRTITLILLLVAIATGALAQQGLRVADIFSRYGHERGCKMVEMHDTELHGYELKTYQSLTYRIHGDEIAPLLEEDRRKAKKIREVVSDGRVSSGYYIMPPTAEGLNRYVLYTQKQDNSGAIVYIEGKLEPDDILKLCYQRRK